MAEAVIRLGLRENFAEFSLLVVVNAFVGAMVGLERSILPAIAEQDFHIAARAAVLSFIVVLGITKALTDQLWCRSPCRSLRPQGHARRRMAGGDSGAVSLRLASASSRSACWPGCIRLFGVRCSWLRVRGRRAGNSASRAYRSSPTSRRSGTGSCTDVARRRTPALLYEGL